jgi:hypothetical protein
MNIQQIDKELQLLRLKNKLVTVLKIYLNDTRQTEMSCFYMVLDLLKQKYSDANDRNFIEQGVRANVQYSKDTDTAIMTISNYVFNYNNELVLKEILKFIATDTYNDFNKLERSIAENTTIKIEQNSTLNRIEENTNNI